MNFSKVLFYISLYTISIINIFYINILQKSYNNTFFTFFIVFLSIFLLFVIVNSYKNKENYTKYEKIDTNIGNFYNKNGDYNVAVQDPGITWNL